MNAAAYLWGLVIEYGWLWTAVFIVGAGIAPFLGVLVAKWPGGVS